MSRGDELRARLNELAEKLPAAPAQAVRALTEKLEALRDPIKAAAWPPVLESARAKVDTRHADPATSHRPVIGPPLVLAKRTFRAVFQPLINEVMRKQVEFNEALLHAVMTIYETQQEQLRTQAQLNQQLLARLQKVEEAKG